MECSEADNARLPTSKRARGTWVVVRRGGGWHISAMQGMPTDPEYAATLHSLLSESAAPRGPIRFDVDRTLRELADGQATYGLLENVER